MGSRANCAGAGAPASPAVDHEVLGVDLEETDIGRRFKHFAEVLGLQADAGGAGSSGNVHCARASATLPVDPTLRALHMAVSDQAFFSLNSAS